MTFRLTIARHDGTTVFRWVHGQDAGKRARQSARNLEDDNRVHRVHVHQLTESGWERA